MRERATAAAFAFDRSLFVLASSKQPLVILRQAIGSVEPSRELVMRRTRCGEATLDNDSAGTNRSAKAPRAGVALAIALAVAALPACESNRRGTVMVDRHESTTIGSGVGEATSDVSDFELSMLDRPAPPQALSTWLEVEIAGGRTWLNLDRVESITVPSILNPVGRLGLEFLRPDRTDRLPIRPENPELFHTKTPRTARTTPMQSSLEFESMPRGRLST